MMVEEMGVIAMEIKTGNRGSKENTNGVNWLIDMSTEKLSINAMVTFSSHEIPLPYSSNALHLYPQQPSPEEINTICMQLLTSAKRTLCYVETDVVTDESA